MESKDTYVTKTFLPPLEEYQQMLKDVWDSQWVTNNGINNQELEVKLSQYLSVDRLVNVSNGTIGLQIALKALDIEKEVITTPFSYVATTSSILWHNCKPVFVDIDPQFLTIDPDKISEAITDDTTAILATHVYGNACDIERIQQIAKKHNLKVIYDAAHCFGVYYADKSILDFGDLSVLSFHATKLFHTIEGGAIVSNTEDLHHKVKYMRNFGHDGEEKFHGLGINGKMSELHAAIGLLNLRYVDQIINSRKKLTLQYDALLPEIRRPEWRESSKRNYAYYPVLFESEDQLKRILDKLNENSIYPRRYFYPSLNALPYVEKASCPIAESSSKKVLCLPLFHDLQESKVEEICKIIIGSL